MSGATCITFRRKNVSNVIHLKPVMNIRAKKGTKVVFAYPDAGYPFDQEFAKKHLVAGETYTVEKTVIRSCETDVFLKEFPDMSFNSVLFTD
jgi:hypothetical protein